MATGTWNDSTATIWIYWTSDTATSSSTNDVWSTWASDSTTNAATYRTSGTWNTWVTGTYADDSQNYSAPRTEPTREELEERQRDEQERERARVRAERDEANRRAEELLRENLTPEQLQELDELGNFIVQAAERRYRISRGRSMNIEELDELGEPVARLCAHPQMCVPDADTMLAQKLMLETDEAEFRHTANIRRL